MFWLNWLVFETDNWGWW